MNADMITKNFIVAQTKPHDDVRLRNPE